MLVSSLNDGACKTWLLACPRAREAMLVDPLVEHADRYLAEIDQQRLRLVRVLDTHTHADHVSAGMLVAERAGVPYTMHAASSVQPVTERVRDGDTVAVGDLRLRALHTPGHTQDSLSLVGEGVLLTGDFLFLGEGGAGRTDLLGGDPGEHWDSLQKLSSLRDELTVLPGHDYRGGERGTLGQERHSNPRLQMKSRSEYVRWLQSLRLEPAAWMLEVLHANAQGRRARGTLPIPEGGACCEVGGATAPPPPDVPSVSAHEVAARLAGGAGDFMVLDVREGHEFTGSLGRVPGAKNISVNTLADRLPELHAARTRDIFVICLSGGRSARATDLLRRSGFTRAKNVQGGMKAWAAAELTRDFDPLVLRSQRQTRPDA